FEEDDRQQVLRRAPVTDSPEAVVVDRVRVALEQRRERLGVAGARSFPEGIVGVHVCRLMSGDARGVPDAHAISARAPGRYRRGPARSSAASARAYDCWR